MEFEQNLGLGRHGHCGYIKDYQQLFYSDGDVDDILVTLDDGIQIKIDSSWLNQIKEAKEKQLCIHIEYELIIYPDEYKECKNGN